MKNCPVEFDAGVFRFTVSIGLGICLVRRWANGGVCKSKRRLEGKTVLVTGGNIGIGLETARDMARRGELI